MTDLDLMCKGSFLLGTACGKCSRCREEALSLVAKLLSANKALQEQLALLIGVLPRRGHGYDFTDEFKVQCFEEARRVAYELSNLKEPG